MNKDVINLKKGPAEWRHFNFGLKEFHHTAALIFSMFVLFERNQRTKHWLDVQLDGLSKRVSWGSRDNHQKKTFLIGGGALLNIVMAAVEPVIREESVFVEKSTVVEEPENTTF